MKRETNISFEDFAKIVQKAIEDEPFFDKQTIIPKIKALAYSLKLNISGINYNKIRSPTDVQKIIRSLDKKEFEQVFWKRRFREILGEDEFKKGCDDLRAELIEKGFET